MIGLGDVVEDKITGLKGVVVCISTWMYGCIRIGIQPQELKDGKPLDVQFVDEPQLKVIKRSESKQTKKKPRYGPRPSPTRRQ